MGWTGMTAPGMDLDHATEALVFAELGRFLAPVALLSSAVAARWTGATVKVALALPADGGARLFDGEGARSEERRVGKECVRKWSLRWWPQKKKKKDLDQKYKEH